MEICIHLSTDHCLFWEYEIIHTYTQYIIIKPSILIWISDFLINRFLYLVHSWRNALLKPELMVMLLSGVEVMKSNTSS